MDVVIDMKVTFDKIFKTISIPILVVFLYCAFCTDTKETILHHYVLGLSHNSRLLVGGTRLATHKFYTLYK